MLKQNKDVNNLITDLTNFVEEASNIREFPDYNQVISRWRYCPEIDPIFYSKSSEIKKTSLQLEARSMNSYLARVRTFDSTWPMDFISPMVLARFGWKNLESNIIQQTEDVNETIVVCKNTTTIDKLQKELAFYGCSWILKPCKKKVYLRPVNFYTTMEYKNIVDRKDEVVPINEFIQKQFKVHEMFMLRFTSQKIEEKLSKIDLPHYFRLPLILKSLLNITDDDVGPKFKYILILLLYGWCAKTNSQEQPILFCFITGQKIDMHGEAFKMFHPKESHYSWSPWKTQPNCIKEIYDLLFSKLRQPARRLKIRKRCRSLEDDGTTNQEVYKFMNSLTHINSRKRRKSINPLQMMDFKKRMSISEVDEKMEQYLNSCSFC